MQFSFSSIRAANLSSKVRIELGPQSTWTCSAVHHGLSMLIESESPALNPFFSPNFCVWRLMHEIMRVVFPPFNKGTVSYLIRYQKPWAFTGVKDYVLPGHSAIYWIYWPAWKSSWHIMAIFTPSAKPIVFFWNRQSCMWHMHEQGN